MNPLQKSIVILFALLAILSNNSCQQSYKNINYSFHQKLITTVGYTKELSGFVIEFQEYPVVKKGELVYTVDSDKGELMTEMTNKNQWSVTFNEKFIGYLYLRKPGKENFIARPIVFVANFQGLPVYYSKVNSHVVIPDPMRLLVDTIFQK